MATNNPNQNPSPFRAAVYRVIAAFIALVLVGGVLILIKDIPPAVQIVLAGLLGSAALGIEEFIKSQQGL